MRQLRYFGAAMRAGSFNEAARACAISQPALSEQIALLEQALDVRLFERTHGRAQPTPRARALERRLEACLAELGAALRGAQEQEHAVAGLVRIGLVHSYGGCWVLPAVQAARPSGRGWRWRCGGARPRRSPRPCCAGMWTWP